MILDTLTPDFRSRVDALLAALRAKGIEMRPYYGIRTPFQQAALWRQSRTSEQIAVVTARLRGAGAKRIAACIESVGPQHGPRVTNAIPGCSWHQYGEAVDCFRVRNGEADWDEAAYREYAAAAREAGLKPGADFRDYPHVQLRHHEPQNEWNWERIEIELAERFPTFAALK